MLTFDLVVRDERGEPVDPVETGVHGLVAMILAHPPDDVVSPDSDLGRTAALWGTARLALEAVEQVARQVAALRAACVAAVGDQTPDGLRGDRVLDELSCTLLVSRRSAQHTRSTAEMLRSQPQVWTALARGDLDTTKARILSDAVCEIPLTDPDGTARPEAPQPRAVLLREGLDYACEHTARRLDLFLQRRLAVVGCGDRPERRRRALAERGVWIAHDGAGTADLTARLSSEEAERVYAALRAVALADRNGEPMHDETCPREPLGPWLAAALVDSVLGPTGHGRPGVARVDTVINVTIPIDSLAGLSDQPGIVNGFGAIPADAARRLAAGDSRWRQVLTCRTTGAVLDVGTLSYRPPAALDRHVRLRDGTCRFPGCQVPASECDLDHLVPFPAGPTCAENLHALCRRHHGLKHEGDWHVEALPDGGLRWTSPQGAVATSHPDDTLRSVA